MSPFRLSAIAGYRCLCWMLVCGLRSNYNLGHVGPITSGQTFRLGLSNCLANVVELLIVSRMFTRIGTVGSVLHHSPTCTQCCPTAFRVSDRPRPCAGLCRTMLHGTRRQSVRLLTPVSLSERMRDTRREVKRSCWLRSVGPLVLWRHVQFQWMAKVARAFPLMSPSTPQQQWTCWHSFQQRP